MDSHELAQRAQKLPDTFADRLTAEDFEDVRDAIRAGEWQVGLSNLIAALSQTSTPITPITAIERDELAALLDGIDVPNDALANVIVNG